MSTVCAPPAQAHHVLVGSPRTSLHWSGVVPLTGRHGVERIGLDQSFLVQPLRLRFRACQQETVLFVANIAFGMPKTVRRSSRGRSSSWSCKAFRMSLSSIGWAPRGFATAKPTAVGRGTVNAHRTRRGPDPAGCISDSQRPQTIGDTEVEAVFGIFVANNACNRHWNKIGAVTPTAIGNQEFHLARPSLRLVRQLVPRQFAYPFHKIRRPHESCGGVRPLPGTWL